MDARRINNINGAQPQFTRVVNANTANTQRILASLDVNNKQSVQAISRILQMSISDLIANTDRKNVRLVDLILGRTASLMDETMSRLSTQQLAELKQDVVNAIQATSVGRLTTQDKLDIIKTLTAYFDGKTNLAELKAGIAQLGILASDQNAKVADVKATVLNSSQMLLAGVDDSIRHLSSQLQGLNFSALFANQQIMLNSLVGVQQQNAMALAQLDIINTQNWAKTFQEWGIGSFFQNSYKMLGDWWRGKGEDSIRAADIAKLAKKNDLDWTQDFIDNATLQIIEKLNGISQQISHIDQQLANVLLDYKPTDQIQNAKYKRVERGFHGNPDAPDDGLIGWVSKPFEKLFNLGYKFLKGHDRIYDLTSENLTDKEKDTIKKSQQSFEATVSSALEKNGLTLPFVAEIRDDLDLILDMLAKNTEINQLKLNEDRRKTIIRNISNRQKQTDQQYSKQSMPVQQPVSTSRPSTNNSILQPKNDNDNWFGDRTWAQSFKNFFKAMGNIFEWLGADDGGQKFWEHMGIPGLPSLVKKFNEIVLGDLGIGKNIDKIVDALIKPNEKGQMPLIDLISQIAQGGEAGNGMFSGIMSNIIKQALTPEKIGIISNKIITDTNVGKISNWLFEGKDPYAKKLIANLANSKDSTFAVSDDQKQLLAAKFIDRIINPHEKEDFVGIILKATLDDKNKLIDKSIAVLSMENLSKIVNNMFDGEKSNISISDQQKTQLVNKFVDALANGETFIPKIIEKCVQHKTLFDNIVDILEKPRTDEKGKAIPSLLDILVDGIFMNIDFKKMFSDDGKEKTEISSTDTKKAKKGIFDGVMGTLSKPNIISMIVKQFLDGGKLVNALCKETNINGVPSSPIERILTTVIPAIATSLSSNPNSDGNKVTNTLIKQIFTEPNCKKLADSIFKDQTIDRVINVMFEKNKDGISPIQKMIDNFINPTELVGDLLKAKSMSEDQQPIQYDDGFKTKIADAIAERIKTSNDVNAIMSSMIDRAFGQSANAYTSDGKTVPFSQYVFDKILEMNKDGDSTITDAIAEAMTYNWDFTDSVEKLLDAKYNDKKTVAVRIADEIISKMNSPDNALKKGEKSFSDKVLEHLNTTQVTLGNGQTTSILGSAALAIASKIIDAKFVSDVLSNVFNNTTTDKRDFLTRFFELEVPEEIKLGKWFLPNIKTKTMAAKVLDTFISKLEPLKPGLIFANAIKSAITTTPPKFEIDASVMQDTEIQNNIAKKIAEQLTGGKETLNQLSGIVKQLQDTSLSIRHDYDNLSQLQGKSAEKNNNFIIYNMQNNSGKRYTVTEAK